MTRSILSLVLVGLTALVATTSTANAATPCTAYAGLIDSDADGYCEFVGAATAATSGWSGKVDCDDSDATVYPGANEIVSDGVDQSCSGADLVLPVSDPAFARYVANSYGGSTPKAETFVAEYDRCKAATGRCTVNDVKGTFDITDPSVDVFIDVYTSTSKVLRKDGVREVVTLDEASHYQQGAGGSTSVYRGPSKATRLAEATAVVTPLLDTEKEARLAADAMHDSRLDEVESGISSIQTSNVTRDALITQALDGVDSNLLAIEAETEARAEADRILSENDTVLAGRIAINTANVDQQGASGVAVNVGIAGGLNTQRERIVYEETIRGPATGLIGFDAAIHVDLDQAIVGPFATVAWGNDGSGSGADTSSLVGFEALGDVSDSGHHVGGFGAWRNTHSMSNMLDTAVPANGACGGGSYRYQANSAGPVTVSPWLRVGPCYETYADKSARLADDGSTEIVVDGGSGFGMTAMGGLSFNITSVRDR